jgi:hypothetical protein
MGLIDSLMEDQTMIQNQFCSFSVLMRGWSTHISDALMSLLHKHQSDRIHTRDLASMTNHGMEGLETDSLCCFVIMGMTLPCCVSHSDALSAVGIKICVQNLLHFMILYVYFGILLTEVEAECSGSFGSTGKCREEAHCSQGEQTKGLHHYLSIASTCLKQNASKLLVHFLL